MQYRDFFFFFDFQAEQIKVAREKEAALKCTGGIKDKTGGWSGGQGKEGILVFFLSL